METVSFLGTKKNVQCLEALSSFHSKSVQISTSTRVTKDQMYINEELLSENKWNQSPECPTSIRTLGYILDGTTFKEHYNFISRIRHPLLILFFAFVSMKLQTVMEL
jgi:hypothetical protein